MSSGLSELRGAGVEANDVPLPADQRGEQGGHQADNAAEVGDAHPTAETRLTGGHPRPAGGNRFARPFRVPV
jgi:hypothetical protein